MIKPNVEYVTLLSEIADHMQTEDLNEEYTLIKLPTNANKHAINTTNVKEKNDKKYTPEQ